MKVLHVAETIKGGVGTVIDELVEYQSNHADEFSVACLVPEQHVDGLFVKTRESIFTFDRKKRGFKSISNLFSKMKLIIKQEKPDVIHFHSTFAAFIGRLYILISGKRKKIHTVYSPHAFAFLMKSSRLKRMVYTVIEYLFSFITDKIICVSNYEYDEAVKIGIKPSKLTVVHNGVKPTTPESFKIIDINERVNFLFVGRFDYQKGIDVLLKAIQSLSEEEKRKYFFNFVGDVVNGESDNNLISPEISSCVTMHGWLAKEKIFEQYNRADCIIVPSRWEGFAMVPLEAMAHGTPVMLSDIPPFRELIEGKNNGVMFSSDDPQSLLAAIRSLDSKTLTNFRTKAFEILLDNYTEDKMNVKTVAIYKSFRRPFY
ncbi:glycosyltransferase [Erwinia sp. SLM-02]|uniref:glycosyltransferase n=1 Tax=Erwinia sp. SLM-02 TaxID=3020057 RepID=UPI0030806183